VPGATISIPPIWRIVTSGDPAAFPPDPARDREVVISLRAGPGFGTGAHETTQICLQAISAFYPRQKEWRLLDFGSGSGILSIAAAKLGAEVDAVEIDELSLEHAEANARINAVHQRIRSVRRLEATRGVFELVVANILLPVLTQAAPELVKRRAPGGALVLSGLVATDVPAAIACYAPLLGGERPEIYERGEWRALAWAR
jgi:ribosomal protein L11 methyltransferase